MIKITIVISIFIFCGFNIFAQVLPHNLSEEERANLPFYTVPHMKSITVPHAGSIRTASEWEEMESVLISWKGYYPFLTEIVRYAREEVKVYIFCSDSNSVKTTLTTAGVALSNIYFIKTTMNSVWIRDFGPNNVYTNSVDSLFLVDWVYNRPRPYDDASPDLFASKAGLPIYGATQAPTDLVNTGGNFMSDGFGNAFASKLILTDNAAGSSYTSTVKTEAQIDTIMRHFMGITRFVKMNALPYDGIHHIDMHMKMINEETILVGQYPTGVADGPQIESNIQFIANNYNSVYGTPYKFVRVVQPPDASNSYPDNYGDYYTYTNSVFLNKTILVPIYGCATDTTALRIYRQALPGYRVVGINSVSPIAASGAIHCTTHEIGTRNPLLISHQGLSDVSPLISTYSVNAMIQHRSGIQTANVYYKINFIGSYTSTSMSYSGNGDIWNGNIPAQNPGDSIYYYIEAVSNSGKTQVRPITAPQGYWAFKVLNLTSYNEMIQTNFNLKIVNSNIASKSLIFHVQSDEQLTIKLNLFDIVGNNLGEIYDGRIMNGISEFSVNPAVLSKGMYFIKSDSKFGSRYLKFIVE